MVRNVCFLLYIRAFCLVHKLFYNVFWGPCLRTSQGLISGYGKGQIDGHLKYSRMIIFISFRFLFNSSPPWLRSLLWCCCGYYDNEDDDNIKLNTKFEIFVTSVSTMLDLISLVKSLQRGKTLFAFTLKKTRPSCQSEGVLFYTQLLIQKFEMCCSFL